MHENVNRRISKEYLGDILTQSKEHKLINIMMQLGATMNATVPNSMLRMMAMYELSTLVSQFQWKIDLDSVLVPTNMIGLCLLKSGAGKDSIRNCMEASLEMAYNKINLDRLELYKNKAIEKATMAGRAIPSQEYHQYLEKMPPLKNSISTVEGLVSRLNTFQYDGIGMPSIFSGEFGSELQTNASMIDNIRLISELYDLGNKESKAIKDKERQDSEVKGMGMSALFLGSPQNLILDESILKKLKTEFVTKLARRSYFAYPNESEYKTISYQSMDEYNEAISQAQKASIFLKDDIKEYAINIGNFSIETNVKKLEMTEECQRYYNAYKLYCESFQNDKYKYESQMLHRIHANWRALKLSGVMAVASSSLFITKEHLHQAISFTEEIINDIEKFEQESNLAPYEKLVKYLLSGEKLSYHQLQKLEFISGKSGNPQSKVQSIVDMGNTVIKKEGVIHHQDGYVWIEKFVEIEDKHGASYIMVSGDKIARSAMTAVGYRYSTNTFQALGNLMVNDTAYSPFRFKNGIRGTEHIDSYATFVVLDIDGADETAEEMHDNLDGIIHHIARTSDGANPYKYRIILPSDIEIQIQPRGWKPLIQAIANEIGVKADLLPMSQIFYGYKGRTLLSCLDGDKLRVSELIKNLTINEQPPIVNVSNADKKRIKADAFNVFSYAYKAQIGKGSIAIFRAYKHMVDLGFTYDEVMDIINDIVFSYWSEPMDKTRFENTIHNQIKRHYGITF